MIRLTQTRIGNPRGNCTEACVCSILELPLEEAPALWRPEDGEERDERWFPEFYEWIRSKGFLFCYGEFSERPLPLDIAAFGGEFTEFFRECEYHLIGGLNPDGVPHMVVGQLGRVVWDTNPLRRGIVVADSAGFLMPLSDAPSEWLEYPAVGIRFEDSKAP